MTPGAALSSTPALAQVWQASTDYSLAQGYRNWRYMTYLPGTGGASGTYELMVYGLNIAGFDSWHTEANNDYCLIGPTWTHPSNGGPEPARVWESPVAGTVRVTGTVAKGDTGGGDGVATTATGVRVVSAGSTRPMFSWNEVYWPHRYTASSDTSTSAATTTAGRTGTERG